MFAFLRRLLTHDLGLPEQPVYAPFTGPDTTILRMEVPRSPIQYVFVDLPPAPEAVR